MLLKFVVLILLMSDEYNEDKRELKKDANGAIDDAHSTLGDEGIKIQAGTKAISDKVKDPNTDTGGSEYQKEKVKEELD
jgi:hypothetical protein